MSTVLPYLAKVTITKSGVIKVFDPFTPTYDFNLESGRISQSVDGWISKVTLKIEDNSQTHFDYFAPGGTYTIQWGKTAGTLSNLTKGFIEIRKFERPDNENLSYTLTCYDRNALQNRRLININRFQKRTSSGSLDATDASMDLGNLARFAIGFDTDGSTANKDAYYPMTKFSNVKTLANEYAISVSGIQTANYIIPTSNADYTTVGNYVKELAEHQDLLAYIDENDIYQFKPKTSTDSGIIITEIESPTDAGGIPWNPAKIAHIIDDEPFTGEQDLTETKNLIVGLGGQMDLPTYTQTTVSGGSDTLFDKYIAFKLPAIKDTGVTAVAVWVDRTATAPDIDLFGELREDNGNTPEGGGVLQRGAFQIGKTGIGTTAGWALANLSADINTQVAHWLILYKDLGGTGSASKTYRWYHAGGAAGTYATSTDGITWTVTGSSKSYAFLLWADSRLISMAEDATSITSYGQRDDLLSDTNIKSLSTLQSRITKLLATRKNPKDVLNMTVFPPDTIIPMGKTVTVKTSLPIINYSIYKVISADCVIDGTGAFAQEVELAKVY